jgi:hypothetical protein
MFPDAPVMRSASNVWAIPTIAVVTEKFFRKSSSRRKLLTVRELALIYDNTCQYCLKKVPLRELTIAHIKPRALGGLNDNTNRTLACKRCNCSKGHSFPHPNINGETVDAPAVPSFVVGKNSLRPEWEPFLQTTVYADFFKKSVDI